MLWQGGKRYHITPLIYLILNSILTERFPVMTYIQIVMSQISKKVKNTLHCNGDTHQAALKKLCRSHLSWFEMVRTAHHPWPPPQEDKTQTQFKTEHSCCTGHLWEGKGLKVWASWSGKGISYKEEKRRGVQTHGRNRSFTSQLRNCWIGPQVTSRRRHKPPGRSGSDSSGPNPAIP